MRIHRRAGTKFYWVYWPGGEQESTKQTTREAAERWAKQRQLARADPAHAAAQARTVAHLIAAYLADRRPQCAPATMEFYEQKLGHIARILGDATPLGALTPHQIDTYATTRRGERAGQGTVTKELKALRAALKKAVRWGWAPPAALVLVPDDLDSGYTPRERWLPPEELDLLLEEIAEERSPECAAAVAYAVASGARRGEIARATRGDLEEALETGRLRVRGTKTRKAGAPITLLSLFRPLLERALAGAREGGPEALAFGSWCLDRDAARVLHRAARGAQLAPVSWNDLRRTHGRWLRRAGVSPELIAEQLRHAGPEMARRVYAQIQPEEVGQQIEAVLSAGCQGPTGPEGQ